MKQRRNFRGLIDIYDYTYPSGFRPQRTLGARRKHTGYLTRVSRCNNDARGACARRFGRLSLIPMDCRY